MARNNHFGGFGGGANMQQLMRQAQKLQEQMTKAQEELDEREYSAQAGGGMISVTVTGKRELKSLEIKPECVDPDDVEMLQDMILAAVNEALRQAGDAMEQGMNNVTNGLNLGEHLLLGKGEEQGGGRNRNSILADAVESVIAACYLDGGMEAAVRFVQKFILINVPLTRMHNVDYKTALQERVQQKKNQVISYRLVAESGPDHDKQFTVELSINGEVVGVGNGSSKKRAEQDAARVALEKFN